MLQLSINENIKMVSQLRNKHGDQLLCNEALWCDQTLLRRRVLHHNPPFKWDIHILPLCRNKLSLNFICSENIERVKEGKWQVFEVAESLEITLNEHYMTYDFIKLFGNHWPHILRAINSCQQQEDDKHSGSEGCHLMGLN